MRSCGVGLMFSSPDRPFDDEGEGEVTCDLNAFLTTEANAEVAPIHPKAMPVNLTSEDEVDVWLNAPTPVAMELQRPLGNGLLKIVARGARQDEGG